MCRMPPKVATCARSPNARYLPLQDLPYLLRNHRASSRKKAPCSYKRWYNRHYYGLLDVPSVTSLVAVRRFAPGCAAARSPLHSPLHAVRYAAAEWYIGGWTWKWQLCSLLSSSERGSYAHDAFTVVWAGSGLGGSVAGAVAWSTIVPEVARARGVAAPCASTSTPTTTTTKRSARCTIVLQRRCIAS